MPFIPLFYFREEGFCVILQSETKNGKYRMKTRNLLLAVAICLAVPMVAQQNVTLDGEWQLMIDGQRYQVTVPHTYNIMEGLEDYAGAAVYQRTLPVTTDMKGRTVRLHFEAVYHDAVVFVNGQKVGEHLNKGYTPFSIDITKALDFGGENMLEVRCSNVYTDKALPYKRHFDWSNDGGIYRSVHLHLSGRQTLRYVHATPANDGNVRFDIRLFEDRVNSIKGQLTVVNRQTQETVYDAAVSLSKKKTDRHFTTRIKIDNPQLWHFDNPCLYDFKFVIPGSDELQDHFGFREFKIEGKRFVLNGEPMRLPGIETMQGSNPLYGMAEPASYIDKTVRMMKDLNTTLTRFHWVQDHRMLDDMDEMGMLAQEELSWWQQPANQLSPELRQTAKEALEEMIEAHYNHPCIWGWGISNEVRGNHEDVKMLGDFVRELDPTRIVDVVANHSNTLLDKDPSCVLDLPTWNDYLGSWHGPDQTLLPATLARMDSAFAGRPLLISEAGLCEPAFTGGDARRVNDMGYHIQEWQKADFICGYIYFCLQDYRTQMGEEGFGKWRIRRHGVTKTDLTPKASYYVLRQLMNPIDITEVKPANAKKKDGSLAEQYNVDVTETDARIVLRVKNTIPSYTLRGYQLRYADSHGIMQTIALPDMLPGEDHPVILKNVNARYAFKVVRSDGTCVIEY